MVVCFIGFQGIVPQAGSADVMTFDAAGETSALSSLNDALSPTGTVGSSLLEPLHAPDALDPMAPWQAQHTSVPRKGSEGASTGAAANRPAAGSLFAPLAELVPTSSFGFRTSPITGEAGEFHTGQDYAAPCGTAVLAADAGTVRAVGWHPWGGGNRVEVDHGNGLITTYNHLQGISVLAGDSVNGGDTIAAIGTTGSSTGCHLHFETILDGEHVDPLRWKLVSAVPGQSTGELKDFSPGGASAADVPTWAQSSTRSDQPAPGGSLLPEAAGQPVAGAVDPGVASRPPAALGGPSASDVPPTTRPVPPAFASPKPQKEQVVVVTAPRQGAGGTPGVKTPDVKTPPKKDASTPGVKTPDAKTPPKKDAPKTPDAPKTDVKTPDAPKTPDVPKTDVKTPDVPNTDVKTPDVPNTDVKTPDVPNTDVKTPDVPKLEETKPSGSAPVDPATPVPESPKPDVSKPNEPAPTNEAIPVPETPEDVTPSCDVDPSAALNDEESAESQPPIDGVVLPAAEVSSGAAVPVTLPEDDTTREAGSTPDTAAEDGVMTEVNAASIPPPCDSQDAPDAAESTPDEGDSTTVEPGRHENAAAPARKQD